MQKEFIQIVELLNQIEQQAYISSNDGTIVFDNQKINFSDSTDTISSDNNLFEIFSFENGFVNFNHFEVRSNDTISQFFKCYKKKSKPKELYEVKISKINKSDDKVFFIILFSQKSDLHKLQNELSDKRAEIEYLRDATFEGLLVHDKGLILDLNSSFTKITGYSANDIIGKSLYDFFDKELVSFLLKKAELEIAEPYKISATKKDGTDFWAEIEGKNYRYKGKTVRIVAVRDISERVIIEQELEKTNEWLLSLINSTPDIICFKDGEGKWLIANNSDLKLFSLEGVNYRGKTDLELSKYTNKRYKEAFEKCEDSDAIAWEKGDISRGEEAIPIDDNESKIYDVIKVPLFNEDGSRKGLVVLGRDITKRKDAEIRLSQNEDLLRSIADNYPNSYISIINSDYTIGFSSGEEFRKNNLNPEEFVGKSIEAVFGEKTEFVKQYYSKSFEGEHCSFEMIYDNQFQKYKTVPLYSDNNEIDKILVVVENITEQKLSEAKLFESERRFSVFMDYLPAGIIITNSEQQIIHTNKFTDNLFSTKNWLGKTSKELFPDKTGKMLFSSESKALQKGYCVVEESITDKNGKKRIFKSHKFKFSTNEKKSFLGIIAIDITEQKKYEDNLKQSEYNLRNAQKISKTGNFILDLKTNLVTCSPELVNILGLTIGKHIYSLNDLIKIVHEGDRKSLENNISKAKTEKGVKNLVFRIKTNERVKYLDGKGEIKLNKSGLATKIIGTCQDITKLKETQEELAKQYEFQKSLNNALNDKVKEIQKINQELELAKNKAIESDKLKSAFLANMSHEIRTPMSGIMNFAELLKEPDISLIEQQEYIQIIENSGNRMLETIGELMDISKIEAGMVDTKFSVVDINSELDYSYTLFKPEAKKKELEFICCSDLKTDSLLVKTDKEKYCAIVNNLIKNALKYTDKGSIKIGYSIDSEKKEIVFFVQDTGIGIAEEKQKFVFDRFIQADTEDKDAREGIGLGLSISKAYSEMISGKLWFESKQGVGSTFWFSIPFQPINETKNPSKHISDISDNIDVEKLNILLVEDDKYSMVHLKIVCKKIANKLYTIDNGEEAVEIIKNNPEIQLVLMDLKLPKLNGIEATKEIRTFNKNIIIFAQTAYALTGDREAAMVAGCNDYIPKPIKREILYKKINNYFNTLK